MVDLNDVGTPTFDEIPQKPTAHVFSRFDPATFQCSSIELLRCWNISVKRSVGPCWWMFMDKASMLIPVAWFGCSTLTYLKAYWFRNGLSTRNVNPSRWLLPVVTKPQTPSRFEDLHRRKMQHPMTGTVMMLSVQYIRSFTMVDWIYLEVTIRRISSKCIKMQ